MMWTKWKGAAALTILGGGLLAVMAGCGGGGDNDTTGGSAARMVFVASNDGGSNNAIMMFRRAEDGSLTAAGSVATGGRGSGPSVRFAGDGLGAAHSVLLSQDHRFLFVTNAGSNNVSVFRVSENGLALTDLEPTGDGSASHRFPNSVTQHGNLVYVLNSADEGSITGFRLGDDGTLSPISGSTRLLAANQDRFAPDTLKNPTQVSFTPGGGQLVVTIKDGPPSGALPGPNNDPTGPGRVLVFGVGGDGLPSANFVRTDLENHGPFGFSFDGNGNMLIALFVGGPDGTASAGSFRINGDGSLTAITRNAPDTQKDTCWLENNGRYAYSANYTSGTISSYRIGGDGSLTLMAAVAGSTDPPGNTQGSTPLDLGITPNGRFLYNVLPGSGKVAAWRINDDGSLTKVGEFSGLHQTLDGDHAPSDFTDLGSPAGIAVL